jgi:hypothetical protein
MPYCPKCGYTSIVHGHPPSNIDLSNFGQNDPAARFRFSAEKSNSCRERDRAFAKAFLLGRSYFVHAGVRRYPGAGVRAFNRLWARAPR